MVEAMNKTLSDQGRLPAGRMLVAVASQGRMRMQLPQNTRICDLPQFFEGPATIEFEQVDIQEQMRFTHPRPVRRNRQ